MLEEGDKYFFVSDVHLGAVGDSEGAREKAFLKFLKDLPEDTRGLFFLGDIFDFWVEYRDVAPRGFVRVLGELARLADRGVEMWFFAGNHDYWVFDYLRDEIGMHIITDTYRVMEVAGRTVCMGHGDGVGRHSLSTRLIFRFIRSPFWIAVLKIIHPWFIFRIAHVWSRSSRRKQGKRHYKFRGTEDPIYRFADELGRTRRIDMYVFGHLHSPAVVDVPSGGRLFILDDWAAGCNYLNLSGMCISGRDFPKIEK